MVKMGLKLVRFFVVNAASRGMLDANMLPL
jgi:hypothetical protein